LAANVVSSLAPVEREVLCADQRWYLLHITPYKTLDHAIKGAVISLQDIDSRRRGAASLRDPARAADLYLPAIELPLVMVDSKLQVLWANQAFESAFELSRDAILRMPLDQLTSGKLVNGELTALVGRVIETGVAFRDVALKPPGKSGRKRMAK